MTEADATTFTCQPNNCRMPTKDLSLRGRSSTMGLPSPADLFVGDQRTDPMQFVPSIALGLQLCWGLSYACHLMIFLSISNSGLEKPGHKQNQLFAEASRTNLWLQLVGVPSTRVQPPKANSRG